MLQLSAIMGQVQLFPFKDFDQEQLEAFSLGKEHVALYGLMLPNRGLLLHILEKEFVFLEMNRLKMSPVF